MPMKRFLSQSLLYMLLAMIAFLFLLPFLWMLINTFKPSIEIIEMRILPSRLTLEHFERLTSTMPIWRNTMNSLVTACSITAGTLLFSTLVAYGIAKIPFPGRGVLFQFITLTLIVPGSLTLIPRIMIVNELGWINTYYALIVPSLVSTYNVFFFRQFFMGIPMELNYSAHIDGASEFQIYYRIVLPLAKPALITLGIFSFLAAWDDFMWPLMVTNSDEMRTLPIVVALFAQQFDVNLGEVMTIGSITALPMIVVYLAFQKHFVNGLVTTGLKM
ncbi:carbohydrate ABC transporter permease [Paenibacillus sp. GCM10023252]|uniref:carbohydrate ABC transporter permease n=1 Tax=Paenibacillus sp. GCM10023252 TaxID=3252649 RepID=UPI0036234B1B